MKLLTMEVMGTMAETHAKRIRDALRFMGVLFQANRLPARR